MDYNKLWKLLIDRGMNRTDLCRVAGITTNSLANMGKGKDVSTQVLSRICRALNCKLDDIVDISSER